MSALVAYDTAFGNTARIAEAIRSGLGNDATAREVEIVDPDVLATIDLLVIGSPTQNGHPTPAVGTWIARLPESFVSRARFAAFDTRFADGGLGLGLIMRVVGHAAPRMSRRLRARGAIEIAPAEGFIVVARDGPLAHGEEARAFAWGQSLGQASRLGTAP